VAAAILFLFLFTFEGFQSLPVYEQASMEAKCLAYKSCSVCLSDKNCGWAKDYADGVKGLPGIQDGTVIACIPQSGGQPFITSNLANWMIIKDGTRRLMNFVKNFAECTDVTCTEKANCGDCVKYNKCAWQQDMGSDNTVTQKCVNRSDTGPSGPSKNVIISSERCPVPACDGIADCQTCANTTGCGFCTISGKCLKNSEFGTGTNQCHSDNKVTVPASCPCAGISSCSECTKRVGCGYCKDRKQCVNLDRYGMPPKEVCLAADTATSESQCAVAPRLSPVVGPTAEDIASAQNGGNLMSGPAMPVQTNNVRPDTGQPVSAAKNYSMVTAPGVARPLGASSIPASVRHDMDNSTPLEDYVKMLVTSQLAAQGVPTNEPFQVKETEALANASDYMRKVFRGVFN
jgi:hypothetical protein